MVFNRLFEQRASSFQTMWATGPDGEPASLAGTRLQKAVSADTESALRRYSKTILDLLEKPMPIAAGTTNSL